ncbi:MAG: lysophospholipid acyltransferase family protein [Fimbriimonadaceae bacterium]
MSDEQVERQSPLFNKLGLPVSKFLAWLLLLLFGPLIVRGKYRVPKKGGLLILSNHISDLDPPAVQVSCPRTIYFMAKSELFDMPVLGRMIRWFKAFPVKRGEPDRASIKKAIAYLRAGETVCIFPEGELSEDGNLWPLKPGVALIVRMAEVPVICVGLVGTNKIVPCGKLIPRPAFGGVSATWGEVRSFDRRAETEEIMGWVEGQLRELTEQ